MNGVFVLKFGFFFYVVLYRVFFLNLSGIMVSFIADEASAWKIARSDQSYY